MDKVRERFEQYILGIGKSIYLDNITSEYQYKDVQELWDAWLECSSQYEKAVCNDKRDD